MSTFPEFGFQTNQSAELARIHDLSVSRLQAREAVVEKPHFQPDHSQETAYPDFEICTECRKSVEVFRRDQGNASVVKLQTPCTCANCPFQ